VGETSLFDKTKKESDPTRYVNTNDVPVVVYPESDTSKPGHGFAPNKMTVGDLGITVYQPMYDRDNKEVYRMEHNPERVGPVRISPVIYGDSGPQRGEASMATVRNLRIDATPHSSPLSGVHDRVLYIGFPGSAFHPAWPVSNEQIGNRARQLYEQWGGDKRATEMLTPPKFKNK
jgi:hypothetical protein